MRAFLILILALAAPRGLAAVSYWQPDASDLWWNPDESGWGVNLVMQSDVIFATFFVYAADGRPKWYVAPDMRGDGAPADQPQRFSGRLYETTGPVVTNAPFNPGAVTHRDVGAVTFEYIRPTSGIITYSVDGATVSKPVRRQTWRHPDLGGEFYLNRVLRPHLCSGPNTGQEPSLNEPGVMTVSASGTSVQISVRPVAPSTLSCNYSGTRTQEGRMARIAGTYACSDGTSGPFTLSEVQVSNWGFMGRIAASVNGCNMNGHFGGARTTVFESPS